MIENTLTEDTNPDNKITDIVSIFRNARGDTFWRGDSGTVVRVYRRYASEVRPKNGPLVAQVFNQNGDFVGQFQKRYESAAAFSLILPETCRNERFTLCDVPPVQVPEHEIRYNALPGPNFDS